MESEMSVWAWTGKEAESRKMRPFAVRRKRASQMMKSGDASLESVQKVL